MSPTAAASRVYASTRVTESIGAADEGVPSAEARPALAPLRYRPTIRAPHELLCGARRHRPLDRPASAHAHDERVIGTPGVGERVRAECHGAAEAPGEDPATRSVGRAAAKLWLALRPSEGDLVQVRVVRKVMLDILLG